MMRCFARTHFTLAAHSLLAALAHCGFANTGAAIVTANRTIHSGREKLSKRSVFLGEAGRPAGSVRQRQARAVASEDKLKILLLLLLLLSLQFVPHSNVSLYVRSLPSLGGSISSLEAPGTPWPRPGPEVAHVRCGVRSYAEDEVSR
uniref:Putative secreted protein n=1 Tax=Anopheles darlingi TaxID=43151 RepID=A0A2M4DPL0_ANODA